jgi:predicted nucleic acid-binding protein
MLLVDANIFMYAAGAEHPHKAPSIRLLREIASGSLEGVIDAEILQEILHRYRAIRRWDQGKQVFDLARRIVPFVLPVTAEILDQTREIMDNYPELSARDALHTAAAWTHGIRRIASFDGDFDDIGGIERLVPGKD